MNIKIKNNKISSIHLLKKIYFHLENKRKREVFFVLVLSIFSSLAESISIALLIPFVSFFTSPEIYLFNNFFVSIFDFLNIKEKNNILAFVSCFFILTVLLGTFIKLRYIKKSNYLADSITSDFKIKIFNFLINQKFEYFFTHGSNELMSNLTQKTNSFTTIIFSAMNIVNAILISFAILFVLIINEPVYTPIIIVTLITFFLIIFKIKSKIVLKKGESVNLNQNFLIDIFENAVGYLQEIFIYDLRSFFLSKLKNASEETAKNISQIRIISLLPKIFIETSIIIIFVIFIYVFDFSDRSLANNISYLAILAFGAQKCLPLINSIYVLSINFKGATPLVLSSLKVLGEKKVDSLENYTNEKIEFNSKIKTDNISYKYDKNLPNIVKNLNFVINKGEKILIKGQSGSGKTTIANIILGLLEPSSGKMYIDDHVLSDKNIKSWQKKIAILPQTIFLNDASIQENIALGFNPNEINYDKIKKFSKIAEIDKFIEKLPQKYNEKIGEKGIRLSGGQKQRVGIARALYREAEVLILDEPTNGLDSTTELQIFKNLLEFNKDMTIIIISHSSNFTISFDKIINLDDFKT